MTKPFDVVLDDTGHVRSFTTFDEAEKYAKGRVRAGRWEGFGSVWIAHNGRRIASVNPDALDRVWTDIVDRIA